MRPGTGRTTSALLAVLLCSGGARALDPRERAGKEIFSRGERPGGGGISAAVSGTVLPATAVPCSGCHGEDARGRPEGGVLPSDITWSELVKPYGHLHPGGREHPPFTEGTLARAVSDGVDPAGNPLDEAMPRYSLSREDMESLVAYLRRVEEDHDPGVSRSALRIGAVLPTRGRLGEIGRTMQAVLRGYFEERNGGTGVHGRKLELVVAGYDSDRATGLEAARELLSGGRVLALVSGLFPGAEAEVAAAAEEARVPLVGPHTLFATPGASTDHHVFRVLSGPAVQARVLVDYAVDRLGLAQQAGAVLRPDDGSLSAAAQAALARGRERGLGHMEEVSFPRGRLDRALAAKLRKAGVGLVVFLGSDADLAVLLGAAGALGWSPWVLVPGTLAARAAAEAPPELRSRVLLAYPSGPGDEKPEALEELRRITRSAGVSRAHRAAQVSAYAAAAVLVEGLRRAGRAVSREKLVRSLEGLYLFDSGLAPPVSYGAGRRVGALGSYVVSVDPETKVLRPASGWMEPR